jgi:hypothetical protein
MKASTLPLSPPPVQTEPEPEGHTGQGTVAIVIYDYEVCLSALLSDYSCDNFLDRRPRITK